ncbi:hypothetical protein HanRHA438_Chr15g0700001 [Helianthus annuus]|uniref:Uncharacterized protein n=2 Tax=Helianthus annuus TaxID=4232 RepID=A0A251S8C3_HELAN|nr:hypothetical protein HanXRQr2_Chr15g0687731 [Helianthus annuus]KAJ0450800.1 hypothetical protein HanHA300_Chr15g0560321 [Helianthus annuus]KAJ0472660.1 hypothetical protein HanHA89_Chr15g0609531 [Helianthus annuus]KAJ0648262.1 hypothetical protein HanLR1_Chr15g0570901 [Helianthus annuus]KAJ0652101.1 hypothetical protein HanOQP8_Chr15g0568311 [Helianthus annuus]
MRFLATGTANVIPILKCILLQAPLSLSHTHTLSLSLSHTHTQTHFSLIPIQHLNINFSRFIFTFKYQPYISSNLSHRLHPSFTSVSISISLVVRLPEAVLPDLLHFTSIRSVRFNQKIRKMNHCGVHQKNTFGSSQEERRRSVLVSGSFDNVEPMVCPKPRRLSLFSATMNEPVRSLRWQMSEVYESKAGSELQDIFFAKGGGYSPLDQICTNVASSPPFFSGSPPSRVSNPLTQDARFGDEKISPLSPRSMVPNPASSGLQSSPMKGGCNRSSFGNKPAVRIEGFDCLDRDNRRNCSIATLA